MRFASFASLATVLLLVPACQLYFDGDDTGDDDPCDRPVVAGGPSQRLVNPDTLACQTFTEESCNPECGQACPGGAIYVPPWGECSSPCVGKAEAACMADNQCRVARAYGSYYAPGDSDDYMGCYPIGTSSPPINPTCEGLDAELCSVSPTCSALYEGAPGQCNAFAPEACIGAQFRECIPEARVDAGECFPAACRAEPPPCPGGTTPGVANGCYTGACIPNGFCEQAQPPL